MPANGFAPAVRQALAGSGSGGAEYLLSLAQPLSPRCGLPSPRPQRDAPAGKKVASGDFCFTNHWVFSFCIPHNIITVQSFPWCPDPN